jgi:hypothetical protein
MDFHAHGPCHFDRPVTSTGSVRSLSEVEGLSAQPECVEHPCALIVIPGLTRNPVLLRWIPAPRLKHAGTSFAGMTASGFVQRSVGRTTLGDADRREEEGASGGDFLPLYVGHMCAMGWT